MVGGGHGDLDFRHFALTLMNLIFYLLFDLHWVETISFSGFFLPFAEGRAPKFDAGVCHQCLIQPMRGY